MNAEPSAYGYSVEIDHGITTRSAAHTVEKPSSSARRASVASVSRDAARPDTGKKTPRSIPDDGSEKSGVKPFENQTVTIA